MADKRKTKMSDEHYALLLERFKGHAAEIGHIAFMWNGIHAKLGEFFETFLEPADKKLARAIWETLKSDRAQRETLREAALVRLAKHADLLADFCWLISETERLSTARNDALHAAYVFSWGQGVSAHYRVPPGRASRLKDKDLLREFQAYRDDLNELRCFAIGLHLSLRAILGGKGLSQSLPERPSLRAFPPAKNSETKSRPDNKK